MQSVLIVDDYAPFRAAVRELLERGGFLVVGEAGDMEEALDGVRRHRPDVILLDVQLPGDDGFVVCERILSGRPGGTDPTLAAPAVVLTSGRPRSMFRRRLAASRARGFIAKTDLTAEALAAMVRGGRQP